MTARCRGSAGFKAFILAWVLGAAALHLASAQEEAGRNPSADVPREVVLQLAVAPSPLESLNNDLAKPTKPFLKEPETSSHHVFRSRLRFGEETNNRVALIWDQPRQKLYLDLNRNLDLTDDPGGVFSSADKGFRQTFTNVTVLLKTASGLQPVVLELQCATDSNATWAGARVSSRSFWQAKVTVAGQEWQVAALRNLGHAPEPAVSEFLLLRPWAARTNRVSLYDPTCGIGPVPDQLFWLGQAFRLEHRWDTSGAATLCKLEFTPQQPPLVETKLSGEFLTYAVLRDTNGYTAMLSEPPGTVRIPEGTYTVSAAWLRKGPAEAFQLTYQPMVYKTAAATNLVLGGPLTNWVVLNRTGRKLQMNYQLRGADGRDYRMAGQDRSQPPEFTVYYGGKKALVGKFEFG